MRNKKGDIMQAFSRLFAAWVVAAVAALPALAGAQSYPSKPIRLIVTVGAGGATDIMARALGDALGQELGQPVTVVNQPGASGIIGAQELVRSQPDGYTLLMTQTTLSTLNALLFKQLPYDPKKLVPISLVAETPLVLVAHPSVPAKNVSELVSYAKAHPGQLNFATIGRGTLSYLGGEMLNSATGIQLVPVMYNSTPTAQTDVLSGRVQLIFDNITTAKPNIEAGKVRALGVTTAQRAALLPDVPTIAESGFPGFDVKGWYGLVAPPGTPRDVVETLHAAVVQVMGTPAMKQRLGPLGARVKTTTPREFTE